MRRKSKIISLLFIGALFFTQSIFAQKVGINTNSPDSTFSIKNKFHIGGNQGDLLFTDDRASIQFPNAIGVNTPMINLFKSGLNNSPRMIFALSPFLDDWGLQFHDGNNHLYFLADGQKSLSLDLANARMAVGNTGVLNQGYTINVGTDKENRGMRVFNSKITTATTFGLTSFATGTGSGDKIGGDFLAIDGTGENIGIRTSASGGSLNYGLRSAAPGAGNYAGYFEGRGYFSEPVGLGDDPDSDQRLNVYMDKEHRGINVYAANSLAGNQFGNYTYMSSQGVGGKAAYYGLVNVNSATNSSSFGVNVKVQSNSSPAQLFGVRTEVTSGGTGNRYGIYSFMPAPDSKSWSAYLRGKVQIIDGENASLTQDGHLQLGLSSSINMVMDQNSISARINGAAAVLELQPQSGQVSIGGGLPPSGFLLTVDGNVLVEELKVQLSQDWPDYVFDDSYSLKTIEEVESHIQEHKHLPGIPSAKEIEQEGILVGDMQKRQMEKIEELTLYMIEMNKRMKVLEQEKVELKKRIEQLENK